MHTLMLYVQVYNIHDSAMKSHNSHFLDINAESFRQSLTLPGLGAFYIIQQVSKYVFSPFNIIHTCV